MHMITRYFKIGKFNVLIKVFRTRFNVRIAGKGLTIFAMLSRTQKLVGVTSRCFDMKGKPDGKHIIMWDLDSDVCPLEKAKETLVWVQKKYDLSNIYLTSDKRGSYRAWCYNKVDEKTLYHIIVDSLDVIDFLFFYHTVKRRASTLRTCSKAGRISQKCVDILPSYFVPFPKGLVERVIYETGLEKKGSSLVLGLED
jgi:hypothetical protein